MYIVPKLIKCSAYITHHHYISLSQVHDRLQYLIRAGIQHQIPDLFPSVVVLDAINWGWLWQNQWHLLLQLYHLHYH